MPVREHKRFSSGRRIASAVMAACALVVAIAVPLWLTAPAQPDDGSFIPGASDIQSDALQAGGQAGPGQPSDEEATPLIVSDGEDGIAAEHEAGVVLVQLADGVTAEDLNASLAQVGCVRDANVDEGDVVLGYVELPLADGVSVTEAMDKLQSVSAVQATQPNYVYHVADDGSSDLVAGGSVDLTAMVTQAVTAVNDYYYVNGTQWNLDSVKAPEAWDIVKTNGRVTVALFDTGCYSWHEDLRANVVNLSDVTADSGVGDMKGHGTHVAGIVAAEVNNEVGIAGVSYNAGLLPVQVFTSNYTNTSAIVSAYNYLIKSGPMYNVRVVNMSLGSTHTTRESLEARDPDKALHTAVQTARDKGILTVCSVGNSADDVVDSETGDLRGAYYNFPSDNLADCALTVIALEKTGNGVKRAAYSNYNMPGQATKEISAPGSDIISTYPSMTELYVSLTGTSMAAPCVAGVAALVFAANPDLSPDDVEQILCDNTTQLGGAAWTDEYGYGEVNAERAVKAVGAFLDGKSYLMANGAEEQRTTTMTPVGGELTGAWTFSSSDTNIAEVDESTGVVTAVGSGTAVITATQPAAEEGGRPTTVSRKVTVYAISFEGASTVPAGDYIDLKFNEDPDTGMWLIDTTNSQVVQAECLDNGDIRITGVSQGEAYVTATLSSNMDLSISYKITVTAERKDLSKATVSMAGWTYDGLAHSPAVTVKLGNETIPASDYMVSYSGNVNAGTCTATVTPKDASRYKNRATGTCAVSQAVITGIALSPTSYSYDGTAKTPSVTVYGPKNGKLNQVLSTSDYDVAYQDGRVYGGTYTVTAKGKGNYKGTQSKTFTIVQTDAQKSHVVEYRTHIQNVGWETSWKRDGATSGTSGKSLRLEGIYVRLADHPYAGDIEYRTHIQNIGWEKSYAKNGAMSGTSGRALRLEAIQIRLTGQMAVHYDVYYRVHAQNVGWMDWAKNGAQAGTAGFGYRLEAIQIRLVPKGSAAPGATAVAFRNQVGGMSGIPDSESMVLYQTHVQNVGWQNWMRDGEVAGTSGRSLRLEGINVALGSKPYSGDIEYRTHIQNIGWESSYKKNGAMSGTSGRALRLEAIQIRLTGEMANRYDVYYRVHAQNFGWMDWAKNDARAGTAGFGYRLEAIQVKLVPKGGAAPGSTANPFRQR